MISPKTYFLSEDRQIVVEEGDPKAKFLVVRAGHEINDALAEQYGISGEKSAAPSAPVHGEVSQPPAPMKTPKKKRARK